MKGIQTTANENYFDKVAGISKNGKLRVILRNIMINENGSYVPFMDIQHEVEQETPEGVEKLWQTFTSINNKAVLNDKLVEVLSALKVVVNADLSNNIGVQLFDVFEDVVLLFTASNPELFFNIPQSNWEKIA